VDGDGSFAFWRFGRVHLARSLKCARDLDAEVTQYRLSGLLRVAPNAGVHAEPTAPGATSRRTAANMRE
jgi:hypothetical protein